MRETNLPVAGLRVARRGLLSRLSGEAAPTGRA
jgi:hypothetical protein